MQDIPSECTRDTVGGTIHSDLGTTVDPYPTVVEAIDHFPTTSGDVFQNMVNTPQVSSEPTLQSISRIYDSYRKPRAFGPDTHRRNFWGSLCVSFLYDLPDLDSRLESSWPILRKVDMCEALEATALTRKQLEDRVLNS
jgi:hypothetical protein